MQSPTGGLASVFAPISVIVVDDHPILRQGLRRVIDADPGLNVVGEAGDGAIALRLVERLEPDVLLLDMELPSVPGYEVAERIAEQNLVTRVLAYSAYDSAAYVTRLLQTGASGYLTKDKAPSLVVEAIKAVARGESRWFVTPIPAEEDSGLSAREESVLRMMAHGHSNEGIAEALFIAVNTVRNHVSNIYAKLGVSTSREAVAWAWQHGVT
ncbi:MAG: response regulator transcription factor [Bacteroidota bacterium]